MPLLTELFLPDSYRSGLEPPASAVGLFAAGFAVAGVGVGRVGAGVLAGVGAGVAEVFAFAGGNLGVGVGFGVVTGTGQRTNPVGVTEHPGGKSCMNGLCPGGILIVCPPGPVYVCGGAPAGGAPLAQGL